MAFVRVVLAWRWPLQRRGAAAAFTVGSLCAPLRSSHAQSHAYPSCPPLPHAVPKPPHVIAWHPFICSRINLIGYLQHDVDITYLDSGHTCGLCLLRVSHRRGKYILFHVEFWDELAEIAAAHMKKGDCVYVSGALHVMPSDKIKLRWTVTVTELKYVKKHIDCMGKTPEKDDPMVEALEGDDDPMKETLEKDGDYMEKTLEKMQPWGKSLEEDDDPREKALDEEDDDTREKALNEEDDTLEKVLKHSYMPQICAEETLKEDDPIVKTLEEDEGEILDDDDSSEKTQWCAQEQVHTSAKCGVCEVKTPEEDDCTAWISEVPISGENSRRR